MTPSFPTRRSSDLELAVGGPAADRLGRRLAEHDVHPIDGRLPFETSGQIDGIPQHRIVEALLRSHIADHAEAGVDADADPQQLCARHAFSRITRKSVV